MYIAQGVELLEWINRNSQDSETASTQLFFRMSSSPPTVAASMAVTNINAKLITFNTSLPYTNVISRLDEAVNKQGSTAIMFKLKDAQSREEIDEIVNTITKLENDFLSVNSISFPPFPIPRAGILYFLDIRHHPWLNTYHRIKTTPCTVLYTIGNPLIAQAILRYDLRARLYIPPRLLVQEKADGKVTNGHVSASILCDGDSKRQRGCRKGRAEEGGGKYRQYVICLRHW